MKWNELSYVLQLQYLKISMIDVSFSLIRDQDGLDQVLEKQTEMIRYLQQHNSILGKKIVEMTQQMQVLESRVK